MDSIVKAKFFPGHGLVWTVLVHGWQSKLSSISIFADSGKMAAMILGSLLAIWRCLKNRHVVDVAEHWKTFVVWVPMIASLSNGSISIVSILSPPPLISANGFPIMLLGWVNERMQVIGIERNKPTAKMKFVRCIRAWVVKFSHFSFLMIPDARVGVGWAWKKWIQPYIWKFEYFKQVWDNLLFWNESWWKNNWNIYLWKNSSHRTAGLTMNESSSSVTMRIGLIIKSILVSVG